MDSYLAKSVPSHFSFHSKKQLDKGNGIQFYLFGGSMKNEKLYPGMLDQKVFENLLTWLDPDRTLAAQEYKTIHLKLVRFFEWNSCYTPEEYADETLDTIAQKIEEGSLIRDANGETVTNKYGYIGGVARNKLKKCWREQDKRPEPLPDGYVPPFDDPTVQNCRKLCLERLQNNHKEEWELLCDYKKGSEGIAKWQRGKIAKKLRISRNALTIRISRIKDKLWQEFQTCMADCLKN